MRSSKLADELDQAAELSAEIAQSELRAVLRRAALMLRNTRSISLDTDLESRLLLLEEELNLDKPTLINTIVREWLACDCFQ